jgi:hypothetical protein
VEETTMTLLILSLLLVLGLFSVLIIGGRYFQKDQKKDSKK